MAAKIVIAEDDINILNLLHIFLSGKGYDVTSVKDGQEALDALARVQPALLITDVMMPRLNGYQLVNAVVNERQDIPMPKVIMLTSRTDPSDVKRGLIVGADRYITKPFDLQDVAKNVQELLAG